MTFSSRAALFMQRVPLEGSPRLTVDWQGGGLQQCLGQSEQLPSQVAYQMVRQQTAHNTRRSCVHTVNSFSHCYYELLTIPLYQNSPP